MRNRLPFIAALAFVLTIMAAVTGVTAGEQTFEGTVVCAKCTLKKTDAKECQNVLLVPKAGGGNDVEYYLAKSEAADKLGEVCTAKHKVKVTGTVAEKDGKKWLTASSIVEPTS